MAMDEPQDESVLPHEPVWHLLYRYIWPFQYFRDVTRGDFVERRRNYRHNRAMRHHLPGFVLKWSILCALWFSLGDAMAYLGAVVVAAGCFVTWTWSFMVVVILGVDWLWLEHCPEL